MASRNHRQSGISRYLATALISLGYAVALSGAASLAGVDDVVLAQSHSSGGHTSDSHSSSSHSSDSHSSDSHSSDSHSSSSHSSGGHGGKSTGSARGAGRGKGWPHSLVTDPRIFSGPGSGTPPRYRDVTDSRNDSKLLKSKRPSGAVMVRITIADAQSRPVKKE